MSNHVVIPPPKKDEKPILNLELSTFQSGQILLSFGSISVSDIQHNLLELFLPLGPNDQRN